MSETNDMFKELSAKIEAMQSQQNEVNMKFMEMFQSLMQNTPKTEEVKVEKEKPVIVEEEPEYLEQPKADELIKVASATKGILNLNVDGRLFLRLEKYGDVKPVLYSKLVEIVNNNRKFAENGNFYILNKNAVFHLGLSNYYNAIISPDVMNSIDKYDSDYIEKTINNLCDSQKKTLVQVIREKVYNDENIDMNKVELISKICNIDIRHQVRQMKELESNMNG